MLVRAASEDEDEQLPEYVPEKEIEEEGAVMITSYLSYFY